MAAQSFTIGLPSLQSATKGAGSGSGDNATAGVAGAHADALMFAPSVDGLWHSCLLDAVSSTAAVSASKPAGAQ